MIFPSQSLDLQLDISVTRSSKIFCKLQLCPQKAGTQRIYDICKPNVIRYLDFPHCDCHVPDDVQCHVRHGVLDGGHDDIVYDYDCLHRLHHPRHRHHHPRLHPHLN